MTLATPSCVLTLTALLLAQGEPKTAPRIEWQRSLADALAVQQATGLPLLIAVNMNGEVFNDRFRTQTYRDPEFVESTRGWVCVVASPDRHTERDYDSLGNRIECPAFPGCTCGEHIAIEPELFAKYFKGTRNAPRHVGVSKDGAILFDRFLDRSMQTAIDAIAKHRGDPVDQAVPATAEDLLKRRDAASRRALEAMFATSNTPERLQLIAKASAAKNAPFDLLRLALHSEDVCEFRPAASALAATATPATLGDLENALARGPELRTGLLSSIERLGKTDERARRLHAHLTGDDESIGAIWKAEWQEPDYEIWTRSAVEAELDTCEKLLSASRDDHETRLRLAIAQLAFAKFLIATNGKNVEFWLEDARSSAKRINAGGLQPEADAVQAVASFLRGDMDAAQQAMAKALPGKGGDRKPDAWLATQFFETVVQLDTRAAYARASDPKAVLQPEVARTGAVLRLLTKGRWATEEALLAGSGLLEYAGLRELARELLFATVRRFRSSPTAHERWRARVMLDLGTEQMRGIAGVLAEEVDDRATSQWFAGYAALVAAEMHVRDGRRDVAVTAYTDSIDRFTASAAAKPDYADSANHFTVLALAGRALARHELGEDAAAVEDLLAARELRSASLSDKDGLGRTPEGIARTIKAALDADGQAELAGRLGGVGF